MKLVVVGATGFLATEVIRQALSLPHITIVTAIARRHVSVPEGLGAGADTTKLKSIINPDLSIYTDTVREALADTDACIWTVSVGPARMKEVDVSEIKRINNGLPLLGVQTLHSLRTRSADRKPLRFLFMSGISAMRDQTFDDGPMAEFRRIRGQGENVLVQYAATTNGDVEVCSARPGIITDRGQLRLKVTPAIEEFVRVTPKVNVNVVAAALLDQVIYGFLKDPLLHDDIEKIGSRALEGREWA